MDLAEKKFREGSLEIILNFLVLLYKRCSDKFYGGDNTEVSYHINYTLAIFLQVVKVKK